MVLKVKQTKPKSISFDEVQCRFTKPSFIQIGHIIRALLLVVAPGWRNDSAPFEICSPVSEPEFDTMTVNMKSVVDQVTLERCLIREDSFSFANHHFTDSPYNHHFTDSPYNHHPWNVRQVRPAGKFDHLVFSLGLTFYLAPGWIHE
jgi:hypothetical protein